MESLHIQFGLKFTNDLSNGQLSNNEAHPGFHDEVDIEFLGTTFGKPYTLQTNVYIRGSGDGTIIGREMRVWQYSLIKIRKFVVPP